MIWTAIIGFRFASGTFSNGNANHAGREQWARLAFVGVVTDKLLLALFTTSINHTGNRQQISR
jgi:hypothetical protein